MIANMFKKRLAMRRVKEEDGVTLIDWVDCLVNVVEEEETEVDEVEDKDDYHETRIFLHFLKWAML